MAEFQTWDRRLLPQGQLRVPAGGNSLADVFGAGLQDLAKAGSYTGEKIAKADAIVQARDDAAAVAKAKPEAMLAYDKIYDDAVANAPEGAVGFTEAVQKATTDYNNGVLEGLSPGARASMQEYLGTLQAGTLQTAHRYQASSDLAKRGRDANAAMNGWIGAVMRDPDALESIKPQIHEFVAGQHLNDANAAAALEHDLVGQAIDAAMNSEAKNRPAQFLANATAGKWKDSAPDRLAQAINQANALLQLKQTRAAAEQANRAVGLQTRVGQAVELYRSGVDFAGFNALAGELKAAGQKELLETLTNWKGDLDYARTAQTLTPAALQAEHDRNLKLAESNPSSIEANTYSRRAEIARVAADTISEALGKDALAVAVQAKIVNPTDLLGPLLNGNSSEVSKALQERETARVQTGKYYGVFVPVLTPDEQQGFIKVYSGLATADEKTALLGKIAALPQEAGAEVANELKPLAGGGDIPMYLSFLSEDRALGHDIIAGAEVLKRYPKLLPEGAQLETEIGTRIGNLMEENHDQQLALHQAITDYYAALVHSKRGEHNGSLDINLLNEAFRRVTGGAFRYDNGNSPAQVIIPPRPGMTEAQFEQLVLSIDENLLVGQSAHAALGSGSAASRQRGPVFGNGRPVTARDIQDEGNFVWVGPGRYRVLINGAPVRDGQTGAVFVLDMNPLLHKAGLQ